MDKARYADLMRGCALTHEEVAAGFHFCSEWDGLLVGPGSPELESCSCRRTSRPKSMSDDECIQDLTERIEKLERENALQADVIEGFLNSRIHVGFDVSREQHLVGISFTDEILGCDVNLAGSICSRLHVQLCRYIQDLKNKRTLQETPPWLDQNEKSKTPS